MKTYWYLTRASGAVALILLTLALVVGIAAIGRVSTRRWPRFAIDGIHGSSSLLAIAFLVVHIVTAVLDSFAPISLLDAVVPFTASYRPLWVGLGAIALDLLLAVAVTSGLRVRLGHRASRAVHWLAYAAWPIALLHGLGTGSDLRQGWMTVVYAGCGAAVVIAVIVRVALGWPEHVRWRLAGLGALAGLALGVLLWLPRGRWDPTGPGAPAPQRSPGPGRADMTLPRLLKDVTSAPMPFERHLQVHGEPHTGLRGEELLAQLKRSGLRGRGGGSFPIVAKLQAVRRSRGAPVVLVNGCEGEPMSAKDRLLLYALPIW